MSSSDSLIEETPAKKRRNDSDGRHVPSQSSVLADRDTDADSQRTRKPAFSPALLSSAFYCGPTMYGGAGACNTRSPYARTVKKPAQTVRVTPANTEDNQNMSQTSRRIMELLEQYSSPASDARRAPAAVCSPWRAPLAPALPSPRRVPPPQSSPSRYKELQVPGLASLMRMKAAHGAASAQRAIAASLSSSQPYNPPQKYRITETQQQQHQHAYKPKMKTRLNGHARLDERITASAPDNHTHKLDNISLHMPHGITPKLTSCLVPSLTKPNLTDHSQGITVTRKFVFSAPLEVIDSSTGTLKNINMTSVEDHRKDSWTDISQTPKRKADTWIDSNHTLAIKKTNILEKEEERRPALPNGDVKSVLGGRGDNSLGSLIAQQKKQWECDTCLSRNQPTLTKCASCQADKPGSKPTNNAVTITANSLPTTKPENSLADFIKQQQKQWECDSCMTRNDPSKERCVCCEGAKPGSTPKAAAGPVYPGMADFIKKQQQQWECPCCMTRNDDNKAKCVCCEAAKPGTQPENKSTFNFGNSNLSGAFKFGIDKADSPAEKSLASPASLPSFTSTPASIPAVAPTVTSASFTFGVPAATNVPTTLPQIPKVNSVFGGDKAKPLSAAGFTFGVKPTVNAEVTEKNPATATLPTSNNITTPATTSNTNITPSSLNTHTPASSLSLPLTTTLSSAPAPNNTPAATPATENKTTSSTFMFSSPIKTTSDLSTKTSPIENQKSQFPSSIFKSVSNVNSVSKESPALTPSPAITPTPALTTTPAAASVPASTPTVPPTFMFGSSSAVKSPPGAFNFGSAATVAPSPFKASSTFTFGNKAPTPGVAELKTPTNSFASPSASAPAPASLFSSPTPQTTTPLSSTPQFPTPTLGDKPKFSFGSSATSAGTGSDMFKTPASTPVFAFGASAKPETATSNLFGTPSKPESVALGPFGSRPAETSGGIFGAKHNDENKTASPFGSSAPPAFGSAVSPFGSSSVPTFGAPRPPAASPFAAPTPVAPPAFGSGSFGAPDPSPSAPFTFGSPTASPAAPITFGSSPAAATPQFGASVPFTDPNSTTGRAPTFKFGQAAPGGFAPTPGPVFSFGSSSGAATPDFSFNMGAPSSAFPPSPAGLPQRRIKKAFRRNVQR